MISETVQLAMIGAVVTIVTAVPGILVSLRNGKKADVIRDLADGTLSKVTEKLDASHEKERAGLERLITQAEKADPPQKK